MNRLVRIGSRDSELALWQAKTVKQMLFDIGVASEIVSVKSDGDLNTHTPLYELGITGIFTRSLDIVMLKREVDIAVHSMKDVPTLLPKGMAQAAVLKRGNPLDTLIHKGLDFLNEEGVVATGSLRRQAQWLHRYPLHKMVDLRGNVPTRLRKLDEQPWNAAIFAAAGLERLEQNPNNSVELQWMVPAPAQGAIVIVAMEENKELMAVLKQLNDTNTEICTAVEREFLRELEGGCSAPIGALASISGSEIQLKGVLSSLDGQQLIRLEEEANISEYRGFGQKSAQKILVGGGKEIMKSIKMNSG